MNGLGADFQLTRKTSGIGVAALNGLMDFSIRSIGGLEWMLERGMDSAQEGLLHETSSVELLMSLLRFCHDLQPLMGCADHRSRLRTSSLVLYFLVRPSVFQASMGLVSIIWRRSL